jgi:hypothetical protein
MDGTAAARRIDGDRDEADPPLAPGLPVRPSRFDLGGLAAVTRAAQVAETLAEAPADPVFRDAVARGDAARDGGDWALAEREYAAALDRYPLHWGYSIQFAHAVKEQGDLVRAEAWYRNAVALGAPPGMVDEHLDFVARRNSWDGPRRSRPRLDVSPLLAPPTLSDIALLITLLRVPGLADDHVMLTLLRDAPDNRAVVMRLMAHPAFARTNRGFLDLVRG